MVFACSPDIRAGTSVLCSPWEPPPSLFWEGSKCTERQPWRLLWAPALNALLESGAEFTQQSNPCPHESWRILCLQPWFREQQMNKVFPYLRHETLLGFPWGSGFQPRNQQSKRASSWQKGDIECWEPAERYSSSWAFDLSWPSRRSTAQHSKLLFILTFVTGGQVQRTYGEKNQTSHLRDFR